MGKFKLGFISLVFPLVFTGLIGCNAESVSPGSKSVTGKSNEPVTLHMVWTGTQTAAEEKLSNPVIKQKFPNVTFVYHQTGDLDKMVVDGIQPDFINVNDPYLPKLQDLGLVGDLSNLLKAEKYDLTRFPPGWITRLRKYSPKGELWAIPASVPKDAKSAQTPYMLVYNKDLFDKFAIAYPKDNMTWDEVTELAKRFNRTEGGMQYRGLQIQNYADVMLIANNPKYIDASGNVDLSDPKWTDHLRILRAAFEANGDWLPFPGQVESWAKQANVAMFAGHAGNFIFHPENYPNLNWDIVTYPSFRKGELSVPDQLGIYVIPSTSEHKELMLDILNAFQSPEYSEGSVDNWQNPILATKNAKAYTNIPGSMYIASKWDQTATAILRKKLAEFLSQGKDINTTLREMQDEISKLIAQSKSGQ